MSGLIITNMGDQYIAERDEQANVEIVEELRDRKIETINVDGIEYPVNTNTKFMEEIR